MCVQQTPCGLCKHWNPIETPSPEDAPDVPGTCETTGQPVSAEDGPCDDFEWYGRES